MFGIFDSVVKLSQLKSSVSCWKLKCKWSGLTGRAILSFGMPLWPWSRITDHLSLILQQYWPNWHVDWVNSLQTVSRSACKPFLVVMRSLTSQVRLVNHFKSSNRFVCHVYRLWTMCLCVNRWLCFRSCELVTGSFLTVP